MAKTKSGGSTKNLRDSQPQYLGVKLYDGQRAKPGSIIMRQRGTRILAGKNVRYGKDYTLYATIGGTVRFHEITKTKFNGIKKRIKVATVIKN